MFVHTVQTCTSSIITTATIIASAIAFSLSLMTSPPSEMCSRLRQIFATPCGMAHSRNAALARPQPNSHTHMCITAIWLAKRRTLMHTAMCTYNQFNPAALFVKAHTDEPPAHSTYTSIAYIYRFHRAASPLCLNTRHPRARFLAIGNWLQQQEIDRADGKTLAALCTITMYSRCFHSICMAVRATANGARSSFQLSDRTIGSVNQGPVEMSTAWLGWSSNIRR